MLALKLATRRHDPDAPTLRERLRALRERSAAFVIGEQPAAASVADPDPRALLAYSQWLDMERRLLSMQLWPQHVTDAVDFVPHTRSAHNAHFPTGGDWRCATPPSARAEAVLAAAGVDWRSDPSPAFPVNCSPLSKATA